MKKDFGGTLFLILISIMLTAGFLGYYQTTEIRQEKDKKKDIGVNVKELGVIPNDGVDRTELFQKILDDHRVIYVPKGIYTISSGKSRNGDGSVWWGLKIPSNTTIHFEKGAVLRFKENMPSWSRVLVIYKAKNIRITGNLEIDGNCKSILNGNEHMANLFIESSKNIFIESAFSHDSYGDNIFVGGTERDPSEDIQIDYFKGETAGRKNFVIHYVNNLRVKRTILDNSKGDSTKGWMGGNSIDLEPDNYSGGTRFYQRFDYVSTFGKGNDFTVGTSGLNSKSWILDIGTLDVKRMARNSNTTDAVMLSYALTVKINHLNISVPKGEKTIPLKLLYAANWDINKLTINGGNKYGISIQYANDEKPTLFVKQLKLNNVTGYGLRNEGGDAKVGTFIVHNISNRVIHDFSTSPEGKTDINRLVVYDSGRNEIVKASSYMDNPVSLNIDSLKVVDKRPTKPSRLIYIETKAAVRGVTIGKIDNPEKITEFSYADGLENNRK